MICPYSNIEQDPDYTMAEFTVFPAYRRKHIAIDAVEMILDKHPGKWEIKYNEKNSGAKKLCVACGYEGPCVQNDDVDMIRGKLLSSDMVVFATPLYYYGMTAQLKAVVDRFCA